MINRCVPIVLAFAPLVGCESYRTIDVTVLDIETRRPIGGAVVVAAYGLPPISLAPFALTGIHREFAAGDDGRAAVRVPRGRRRDEASQPG